MAAAASSSPSARDPKPLVRKSHDDFFIWREFVWGAFAGAFGEGMMHPIDTLKTRLQSQAMMVGRQKQKNILQMVNTVWTADGLKVPENPATGEPGAEGSLLFPLDSLVLKMLVLRTRFYRGILPGVTGSLATGATYFGVIESTKNWIEKVNPNLSGHWSHFIAGAVGDTLGSFVYVPCEVIKQRMQVQGTRETWASTILKDSISQKSGPQIYGYYTGMFQAGQSIWKQHGLKGLYAGYWSTLARDVPFAGLMVTFYEALKCWRDYGKQKLLTGADFHINSSLEGFLLGGLAGGCSAYLTTPLDVIKTRLQVQGSTIRYNGWLDALGKIWVAEGLNGLFRGSVPRVIWYVPASALTFMAVEFLRENFNEKLDSNVHEVTSLSVDAGSKLQKTA